MIETIIKRSGRKQVFDSSKIKEAIKKAIISTRELNEEQCEEQAILATNVVVFKLNQKEDDIVDLEEVQDKVEETLMQLGMVDVARSYIRYRHQREQIRKDKETAISVEKMMRSYIKQEDWKVKENSNMDYSLQGLNNYIVSDITKNFWLNHVFSTEERELHENGDIHIHDLGLLSTYCCGWDLEGLLLKGFRGVPNKVSSSPAKHLKTALGQLVNFIYTLQGEAAGAQAISSFDTYLAPFVYFDELNYKDVKQCVQEFVYNVNVPTRVGFQCPFFNITLDLIVPKNLSDKPVIIGGEYKDKKYGEFQKEMNMINKAFCEVMMKGDASGRIFSFPIPTYNISKDFDWDNEVVDDIMKMTGKYGIPYFANFINSDMSPEDARSMCLFPEEVLFIREKNIIIKSTVKEVFEKYKSKKIDNQWHDVSDNIEALSLNPKTGKVEWIKIKSFLQIYDEFLVTIKTKDGREMKVSKDHLVSVYTENGIVDKKAIELNKEDFLLVLKDGSGILNKKSIIDSDLAWFYGLFVADGNYLYNNKNEVRGIQISFNALEEDLIEKTKEFIKKHLNYNMKFILDNRYENSLRGYIYNKEFAEKMNDVHKIKKYNFLPDFLWNSSKNIIESFIEGFFDGDGYKIGKEIHINDPLLARELNLLFSFVGIHTTLRENKNSQVIRIQHKNGRGSIKNLDIKDTLYDLLPTFLLEKKFVRKENMNFQSYNNKTVSLSKIAKYNLSNSKIEFIKDSDFAVVMIEDIDIQKLDYTQDFYDIELEKNHYFVHSNNNITHNCCRLRIDNRELHKRGGGLFGANPLTGSIGVITINLPRLGYLYKDFDVLKTELKKLMDISKHILETKRKFLEKNTEDGLYPYSKVYLADIYARFGEYWKNHFNTIGINGMNECIRNFSSDKEDITTQKGQKFANEILEFMRDQMIDYQKNGDLYNLEATPAEGTAYRLARIDKKKYPDILTAGKDEPYYTNSTQLPVGYTTDLFLALNLQDSLQTKYTGGTVFHAFLGEKVDDYKAIKTLIKNTFENYSLPYFSITPTFSICDEHGYLNGEQFKCNICGADTEVWTRVVGFYRPIQNFNKGKMEEYKERVEFVVE